jgi:uncharacterized protein (DUF697 family)
MKDLDIPGFEHNTNEWSESLPSVESLVSGCKIPLEINRGVQKLILDYTLGAAILGLIPDSLTGNIDLLILALIDLKMIVDIWLRWGKPKRNKIEMLVVILFALLVAFASAFVVRLIFSLIGLVIPLIIVLNSGVGHATLTWVFGRATNQFFLNATQANSSTLKQLLKAHQTYYKQRTLGH